MDSGSSNIYLLSQPVQSGKTTLLMNWIQTSDRICGMLTPDLDGKRMLFDIQKRMYHNFQLDNGQKGISIGKFVFDEKVFAEAHFILENALEQDCDWIVVDEIGRLEMDRQEGLEPSVSILIRRFKAMPPGKKLLLVIRDYLLEDAKKQYGLEEAVVINREFFLTAKHAEEERRGSQRNVNGLVLCGGQSVRMGKDKALITYHQQPQYAHVADLMKSFCKQVFISCNTVQQSNINTAYQTILDNATFANAGPMSGILSAFALHDNDALFVMGCDYPYFTKADMTALLNIREEGTDVVCYHNPETSFDEPILAVYEKQCAPLLLRFYQNGNSSLQQFLKTVKVKRMFPANLKAIQSVDF